MLKLFKYDFRAISRRLVPLYLVGIIIGVINQICSIVVLHASNNVAQDKIALITIFQLLQMICSFLFFLLMSYTSILTLFILITNFNNSVYGNEGYLINSLPLKSKDLILAKYLNFIFWTFISGLFYMTFYIMGVINGMIFQGKENLKYFNQALHEMHYEIAHSPYTSKVIVLVIIGIILIILQHLLTSWIFMVCVTFANMIKSNKLIMGIVCYIVTGIIMGIIYFSVLISFIIKIEKYTTTHIESDSATYVNPSPELILGLFRNYGIICIIIGILLNVGCFFLINYIHEKKIDLE